MSHTSISSDPIHYLDACELAQLIRERQVSPREVVQAHLDRAAAVNPQLNAFSLTLADEALAAAKQAEKDLVDGRRIGALHGVPFTIKDSLDTAGVRTARGSRRFAEHVPVTDATAVARLKAAGGIPIAKTNVPEFSTWWETDNLLTGRTNNPWNLERTAGGSSGGEAAAIAAGLSPLGLGSDVGISVRGPAHFTGIAALKATHGRIPFTGHWPATLRRMWHVGPMARSIRDIALAYDVLRGPDGVDPYATFGRDAVHARGPEAGQRLRVGWLVTPGFGPVDGDVAAAVRDAAQTLAELGNVADEARIPILADTDCTDVAARYFAAELPPYLRPIVAGHEDTLHPAGLAAAKLPPPSLEQYVAAEWSTEQLTSAFAQYFEDHDVLLCPVVTFAAPAHNRSEHIVAGTTVPANHVMRATLPFNLTGLPALSVPFRFSRDRLPIGVQVVCRWLDEGTALRVGALLEAASQVHGQRPPQ